MGYSGGDMAMTADVSRDLGLTVSTLRRRAGAAFAAAPGRARDDRPIRSTCTPTSGSTWRANARSTTTSMACGFDAVALMLDCPPETSDLTAFTNAIEQFVAAGAARPAARAALLASLPETIPGRVRAQCLRSGVVPLQGQREALEALDQAGAVGESWRDGAASAAASACRAARSDFAPCPNLRPRRHWPPMACRCRRSQPGAGERAPMAAAAIGYPVVMKAAADSLAHKSEVGGVVLNIRTPAEAAAAAQPAWPARGHGAGRSDGRRWRGRDAGRRHRRYAFRT